MSISLTIYCASSRKVDEKYFRATRELADVLLERGVHTIYGGGAVGLMGAFADRYIEKKGKITGIIPEFMVKVEWAHPKIENMIIVNNMHERKERLMRNTDGIIALPGGTGTLEELSEVITLKKLGKFTKPIILLNTDGFYDPLQNFFLKMADEHFMLKEHLGMWKLMDSPSELWSTLENFPSWTEDSINSALV